jgi:hypothetical protein
MVHFAGLMAALGEGAWPAICGTLVTAVIFQFARSPPDDWHRITRAAALLITFAVLSLSIRPASSNPNGYGNER